ncbi:hypothetical protein MBCUT_03160 [Methanobrevibacter cuticularis]|uniref:Uncharacterized protein n=1 Tax=Methanobrevibacter cuticularis TaxID=47311 RepID=A0A166F358_9EURY|nr:hypothetical protein [Methanobrevibacter cuticularis]KZX17269.1 hypothetical protein MBCUT_03160 [Methanobrevibacter cuticularis]
MVILIQLQNNKPLFQKIPRHNSLKIDKKENKENNKQKNNSQKTLHPHKIELNYRQVETKGLPKIQNDINLISTCEKYRTTLPKTASQYSKNKKMINFQKIIS